MKTLLKGGVVLTLDRRSGNLDRGDVLIEDGRIAEVSENIRARDAEVVECSDTIVMPGFVDTHRHAWRSLFRNAGVDPEGAAMTASGYRQHHEPDDLYAATLIGLLGAVASGTTTVVDWADIPGSPEHLDAVLQAHTDSGLRTVFVHPAQQPIDIEVVARRFDAPGMTTLALGTTDTATADLDRLAEEMGRGRALGLRLHAHAGAESSRGAVAALGERGLLGEDVTFVHCTNLGDSDLDAIATSGAAVALTPSTEMASGLGSPPIQQLIDRDIAPGLGVDDESLAPGDVFAQIRATISIQHAALFEQKLAGKSGVPDLMTTREVIRHGTVDGARAAGLAGVTGTLTPGAHGDVIVLRTDRPNIFPVNDPIGAVVWGMDTSNLDWVFASGRALVRNGDLAGDVDRSRGLATEAQQRVAESAGLLTAFDAGGPK